MFISILGSLLLYRFLLFIEIVWLEWLLIGDRLVNSMDYKVVVFDTAPTGHTLRFLSFPSVLEKGLSKISEMGGRFGPMIQQVCDGIPMATLKINTISFCFSRQQWYM